MQHTWLVENVANRRSKEGGDNPNYDGPEHRTGEDRRSGGSRREAVGKHRKAWYVAWGFMAVVLPTAFLFFLAKIDNSSGWRPSQQGGAVNMEVDTFEVVTGIEDPPVNEDKSEAALLTADLISISPNLYDAVKLQGAGGRELVINEDGTGDFEITDVQRITIKMKSETWNSLPGREKVTILKKTFRFLKTQYPLTETIELSFDDNRPNLPLRF